MSEAPAEIRCMRCAQAHTITECPDVKAVEFDAHGSITRVEFLTPLDRRVLAGDEPPPAGDDYQKLGGPSEKTRNPVSSD